MSGNNTKGINLYTKYTAGPSDLTDIRGKRGYKSHVSYQTYLNAKYGPKR